MQTSPFSNLHIVTSWKVDAFGIARIGLDLGNLREAYLYIELDTCRRPTAICTYVRHARRLACVLIEYMVTQHRLLLLPSEIFFDLHTITHNSFLNQKSDASSSECSPNPLESIIMASLVDAICACLCGIGDTAEEHGPLLEKSHLSTFTTRTRTPDEVAADIVDLLRNAEKNNCQLKRDLDGIVSTTSGGWTLCVAKGIFNKLAKLLLSNDNCEKMGTAINDALMKVEEIAQVTFDFARDHPVAVEVFCTILAIGVLWLMLPWVLEVLGFAAEGPVAGECQTYLPTHAIITGIF